MESFGGLGSLSKCDGFGLEFGRSVLLTRAQNIDETSFYKYHLGMWFGPRRAISPPISSGVHDRSAGRIYIGMIITIRAASHIITV